MKDFTASRKEETVGRCSLRKYLCCQVFSNVTLMRKLTLPKKKSAKDFIIIENQICKSLKQDLFKTIDRCFLNFP